MKKKIVSLILVVTVIAGMFPVGNKVDGKERQIKSDYVIIAKDGKIVEQFGESELFESVSNKNDIVVTNLTQGDAEKLEEEKAVISVEEDIILSASRKRNKNRICISDIDLEWNKDIIDVPEKIEKPKDKRVKIAVLDSGVDWGNDIQLESSISFIPGEENMNPLFMDGSGHGNSVAGLIAATDNDKGITGINPEAAIYSVRVLDDDNNAPVSRVIKGIYYAIEKKVNIINMSFGTTEYSEALKMAIDDANRAGILVVAAAGNTGAEIEYPAAFENVLAVGAVNSNANITDFSARGSEVEIVAPGEGVCSTGEFGDILISSGTSLSAPQVAAAASIIWQKDLSMSKDFVESLLVASGNYSCSDSYGVLDIDFALKNYEKFKKQYRGIEKRGNLENKSAVTVTEETGCVTGSWSKDSHEYLVGSGHANVKQGARYPDTVKRIKGITNNPGWHGSYHVNYIAAYIYATRMAEQLGKGNSASAASNVSGLSLSEKSNMLGDVNSLDWSSIGMTTNGKKRAFVWGMAIHTAADVFAHSAFVKSDGEWCHLAHGEYNGKTINNYADNTGKYEERFQAAENVVSKIVAKYDAQSGAGTYAQFKAMSSVGKTFRLRDLCPNILAVNSSADISGLESFSIYAGPFNYGWVG